MIVMTDRQFCLFFLVSSLLLGNTISCPAQQFRSDLGLRDLEMGAELPADWSQVSRYLFSKPAEKQWHPKSNLERSRGPSSDVYPKAAPATVVVRTNHSHGTGFVIDAEGWILTNHHVIEDAPYDRQTCTQRAVVHFGRLSDEGFMRVIDEGVPAVIYKSNMHKDLALLKLLNLPKGFESLPVISLTKKMPRPGTDCIVLGHPAAGLLWTVREGTVAGVGTWPVDHIDTILPLLTATGDQKKQIEDACRNAEPRKILLSSCQLNPGDSGGPLLNTEGELIAVSFAIPKKRAGADSPDLDKFSYHVHLDDVREFLADRPDSPQTMVPDPWPQALGAALVDFNQNKVPDTLVYFVEKGKPPVGLVCDLDEDSELKSGGIGSATYLKQQWDFEFALHQTPIVQSFYDRNNNGEIDLCLVDWNKDGIPDHEFVLENEKWSFDETSKKSLIDPRQFRDRQLRERLGEVLERMKQPETGQKPEGALNRID